MLQYNVSLFSIRKIQLIRQEKIQIYIKIIVDHVDREAVNIDLSVIDPSSSSARLGLKACTMLCCNLKLTFWILNLMALYYAYFENIIKQMDNVLVG